MNRTRESTAYLAPAYSSHFLLRHCHSAHRAQQTPNLPGEEMVNTGLLLLLMLE